MSTELRNPNDTIDNLAIGKIIEVDGAHIVAELERKLSELSRVYAGETYPIGQFGSIVKIHFGRRIIYAFVGRLRMKAEYEAERGIPSEASGDERIVEADLFGEGEWVLDSTATPPKWELKFERGVATYVPNRGEAQYEAAQEAVRRIAKEGRKYGIGLLLVSQRPSEVEATVLSQCNSWIVLRITNDADREHVRSILPDSMAGLTKMLSGLRRQEAIFVGQAAMLPSRILVRSLALDQLPKSHDIDFDKGWQNDAMTSEQLTAVAGRWRYQQR